MKKIILIMVAIALPLMVMAQLTVNSYGKVTISAPSQGNTLTLASQNKNYWPLDITGISKGIRIDLENTASDGSVVSYGLMLTNDNYADVLAEGIHSRVYNHNTKKAIGISGTASSQLSGSIYGVYGGLASHLNGAGIYGGTGSNPYSVDGRYAGYFAGNMKVTGTIDGTLVNSSDARLKEDVQPLSENAANRGAGVLDVLESLTPVSFKYKKMEEEKMDTSATHDKEAIEEEELPNPVMEKEHFGLIAQELQEVYPNLVYEKDNGYLAVNYVELVPVLMQAIKELNAKVAMLEANKVNCSPLTSGEQETLSLPLNQEQWAGSSMEQNVPNPFTEKTDIAIYLPESVREATLYIYDLSGKQLEQHPIEGRGETVMTIHADKMDAGMYVYSLIADKKVVTTRKMIVVK